MPRRFSLVLALTVITAVGWAGSLPAQDTATQAKSDAATGAKNPYTSPSDVNQGRNFFNILCARCHGRNARGAKGPDLTDGVFRYARNDEQIQRVISNGVSGTDMAGFADGTDVWEVLAWQMVAYIRSEETKRGATKGKPPAGDTARGLTLFKQHKCATCHWTGSQGGRRGSDLSRLSASPDYIRKSLTDPDSQIAVDFQLVQIVTEDGQVFSGRRLFENTYFLLFMDEKENLRTIRKSRIEQLNRPHKSLMPSFRKFLNSSEVEDLTTYIFSLRKGPSK